jgi:hypothetical protein
MAWIETVGGTEWVISDEDHDRLLEELERCVVQAGHEFAGCRQSCPLDPPWPLILPTQACLESCAIQHREALKRCEVRHQQAKFQAARPSPVPPPARFSAEQKAIFSDRAKKYGVGSAMTTVATAAAAAALAPEPIVSKAVALGLGLVVACLGATALIYKYMGDDPPNGDFYRIWVPRKIETADLIEDQSVWIEGYSSDSRSIVAMLLDHIEIFVYLEALSESLDRAAGAAVAGYDDWRLRQTRAAQVYARAASHALKINGPSIALRAGNLESGVIGKVNIDHDDLVTLLAGWRADDFDTNIHEAISRIAPNARRASEIQTLLSSVIVSDEDVNERPSVYLSGGITEDERQQVIRSLESYASSAIDWNF